MNRIVFLLLFLHGIIMFSVIPDASAQTTDRPFKYKTPGDIIIDTDMQINLVLIGDTWSEEDKTKVRKKILQSYTPIISSEDRPVGVRYNYTYNFKNESEVVSNELFEFIDNIAIKSTVPFPIEQWMLVRQSGLRPESLSYKLIDAFRVEERLADLDREEGYTIYFLKPSTQQLGYLHTYGLLAKDPDTKRQFVQEGMMGFGGKDRFYFIDLSAGPWLYPFVPISETQAFSEFHRNIYDLQNDEEYYDLIAEYVNDAVMLLFTPSYLYSPTYKSHYKMEVFLIDMTSGRTFQDVSASYIERESIEHAFAKLIPYAQWSSEITGQSFDSLPRELQRAILKSISFDAGGSDMILVKSSGFITELRNWLGETLTEEELLLEQEEAEETVLVPIFLFLFDTDAYVDKMPVVGSAIPDPMDKTIPCCAIVAVDKHTLLDLGTGLSTLAVHEMGHVIGLRHPHDGYSQVDGEFNNWFFDWSYTPMSYASPGIFGCGLPAERCGLIVTEFGTFNLDTMDRGLVLSLLRSTQFNLHNSTTVLQDKGYDENNLPQNIHSKLSEIDRDVQRSKGLFKEMNYFNFTSFASSTRPLDLMDDAFDFALRAYVSSQSLIEQLRNLPKTAPSTVEYGTDALGISEIFFIDEDGVVSDVHEILEPVLIKPTVSSKVDTEINFTAIIQIKDNDGYTVSLTMLGESFLSSNQKVNASLSWTFERPGEFIIEIFLWSGPQEPVPLSAVKIARIHLVR